MTAKKVLESQGVRALLPNVLIEYLWKLVFSGKYCKCRIQTFTLSPGKLGGKGIQEIFHLDEIRRVFGFEPVSCKLRVFGCGDDYKMVLAN